MEYGARNQVAAKVKSLEKGDAMSLAKFDLAAPVTMASLLPTKSLEDLGLKEGDEVQLIIKAVHVLPVKE